GSDALPQTENTLSQHSPRRLAWRSDPRRIAGLLLRRRKSEDHAAPLGNPDGVLPDTGTLVRHYHHQRAVSNFGSPRGWRQVRRNARAVRRPRAPLLTLLACPRRLCRAG